MISYEINAARIQSTALYLFLFVIFSVVEAPSDEAFLPGSGFVRLCCVWQWSGGFSRLWGSLYPSVSIPGWPWLGSREGKRMSTP